MSQALGSVKTFCISFLLSLKVVQQEIFYTKYIISRFQETPHTCRKQIN